MTGEEITQRYGIPLKVLEEYHRWGLCDAVRMTMDYWQYDDRDLERLSTIMALHDIGFPGENVEKYMKLLLKGPSTEKERMKMLEHLRSNALDEIHLKEQQVVRMDYLRGEIRNNQMK